MSITISENTEIEQNIYDKIILINTVTEIRLPPGPGSFKIVNIQNNTDHTVLIKDYNNTKNINLESNTSTLVMIL